MLGMLLAIAALLVTTYFIKRSGTPGYPIRPPDSTASIRDGTITRRVSGFVPPPPAKPVKLSPRGILASSDGGCSRFDFADSTFEIKAEVNYETIIPNMTCSWEIQIVNANDPKKPVFAKPFPDKTVKLAAKRRYTWNFEEQGKISFPLAPGHYLAKFVQHEDSPKHKTSSDLCTTDFEIK